MVSFRVIVSVVIRVRVWVDSTGVRVRVVVRVSVVVRDVVLVSVRVVARVRFTVRVIVRLL